MKLDELDSNLLLNAARTSKKHFVYTVNVWKDGEFFGRRIEITRDESIKIAIEAIDTRREHGAEIIGEYDEDASTITWGLEKYSW